MSIDWGKAGWGCGTCGNRGPAGTEDQHTHCPNGRPCSLCGRPHFAGDCDDVVAEAGPKYGAVPATSVKPRSLRALLQATEAARASLEELLASATEAMQKTVRYEHTHRDNCAHYDELAPYADGCNVAWCQEWLNKLSHARKFTIPSKVRVWVVYADDGDHGFSEPLGVCLTQTGASELARGLDSTAVYIKDIEVHW